MDKDNQINKAVSILNQGGIVIFPTDTAFGIGCRIDKLSSVKRLFKIRKRPQTQAVPVLVDSIRMAQKYLLSPLSDNVRHLIRDYWPGALTIIYGCKLNLVSPLVRGYGKTLGVRMPDNNTILNILKGTRVPVLAPSANFHGDSTPYHLSDLNKELIKKVDFVVSGECKIGLASTVLDVSLVHWKILRQGKIQIDFNKYV